MKALRIITILLFILSLLLYVGVSFRYNIMLDRVSPKIQCESDVLEVSVSATEEELLSGVTAKDNRDGDLSDQIMIQGISRLLTADTARITYVVIDSSDNIASCTRTIRYTDYERPRISLTEMPVFRTYPADDSLVKLCEAISAWDVRDKDISDQVQIIVDSANDSIEGEFTVSVQVTNSLGDSEVLPLTIVIDNQGAEKPLVTLKEYITYISAGSPFDPASYIRTVNGRAYSSTDSGLVIDSNVDTATPGTYQVSYRYTAQNRTFTVYQTVVVR